MPKKNVTPASDSDLDPDHHVDLEEGKFCKTSAAQLGRAFTKFLLTGSTHLCLFFHGGLVSRKAGLQSAGKLIQGYTDAGAYPFFFIWNSDLLTVIGELLKPYEDDPAYVDAANRAAKMVARKIDATLVAARARAGLAGRVPNWRQRLDLKSLAGAVEPYERAWARSDGTQLSVTQQELASFEKVLLRIDRARSGIPGRLRVSDIRGARNPLGRIIRRLNSGHDHGLFTTVIEELYIAIGIAERFAKPVWDRMQDDIDAAFADDANAGGSAFLKQLERVWKKVPDLRVTLIGHSAGSIYVQRFIEALDATHPARHRVEFITLAAAVSFERMVQGLPALQRRVAAARVFGMNDDREGGYWEIPFVYNKSLLYIVCSLCEADAEADRPLLGMQRYWSGSRPYDQPHIKAITAFIDSRQVVWSPTTDKAPPGHRSDADRHRGLPRDDLTNQSVCYALKNGT